MSFAGTVSFLTNNDKIQNKMVDPAKRRKVSENGSISSGIIVREIGVLSPKIKLAKKSARCPDFLVSSINDPANEPFCNTFRFK